MPGPARADRGRAAQRALRRARAGGAPPPHERRRRPVRRCPPGSRRPSRPRRAGSRATASACWWRGAPTARSCTRASATCPPTSRRRPAGGQPTPRRCPPRWPQRAARPARPPPLDAGAAATPERWVVELRRDGAPRRRRGAPASALALPGGGRARLVAPYLGTRLWVAELRLPGAAARLPRRATGARSATATSRRRGRSPTTRRCSPPSRGAPRCRAPRGRSRRACVAGPARPRRRHRARSSLHTGRLLARARRAALPRALPRPREHAGPRRAPRAG